MFKCRLALWHTRYVGAHSTKTHPILPSGLKIVQYAGGFVDTEHVHVNIYKRGIVDRRDVLDHLHDRSRMTIDPRIPTMPERSISGFHRPEAAMAFDFAVRHSIFR